MKLNISIILVILCTLFGIVACSLSKCNSDKDCTANNTLCLKFGSCDGYCVCKNTAYHQHVKGCALYGRIRKAGERCDKQNRDEVCPALYGCRPCPGSGETVCRDDPYFRPIENKVCEKDDDCKSLNITCVKFKECQKGFCGCKYGETYYSIEEKRCLPIEGIIPEGFKCNQTLRDNLVHPCDKDLRCVPCKVGESFRNSYCRSFEKFYYPPIGAQIQTRKTVGWTTLLLLSVTLWSQSSSSDIF